MGRKKNPEVLFWDVNKMFEYAQDFYPHLKKYKGSSVDSMKREILRTISKYSLIDNTNKDSTNEKKFQTKYKLHPVLAKTLIEYIMNDYFLSYDPNKEDKAIARQQQQEKDCYEKSINIIKKRSERKDEKLNQAIIKQLGEYHPAEYDDETNWSAPLPEGCTYDDETTWVSDGAYYYENTPDLNNDSSYSYHIPIEPSYSNEFADKVIDRMMIRAIFDYMFEFKEKEFRRDLEERSKMIDTMEPLQVHPGFTELTKKLENPLENYISLKEAHKK